MAYDEALAERVREALTGLEVREQRMFGGLGFLVGGHLAIAVSGQGGLMVRVPAAETARLLGEPGAEPMVMQGREVDGWVRVTEEGCRDDADLQRWADVGVEHVGTLPPKE